MRQHFIPQSRLELALLVAILALGLLTRVGWPGTMEFQYDEATVARRALALIHEGQFPASLTSSIPGVPQPPLMALVLAIPFALSRNPSLAVAFLGALSVVTIYLTYVLGRAFFNSSWVGLLAAVLFALAPWASFYARKMWAQNIPLLTVIMMLSLFALLAHKRPAALFTGLLSACLLIGLYLGNAVIAMVFAAGLALHIGRLGQLDRRLMALWGGAGAVCGALLLMPYFLEALPQLAQVGSPEAAGRGFPLGRQLDLAARIATGFQFHALAGDKFQQFYASLPVPDLTILDGWAMRLIWVGMVYVLLRALFEVIRPDAQSQPSGYRLLALWLWLPLILWGLSGLEPQPHRYIMLYPAQLLAAAVLLIDAAGWLGGRWPVLRPGLAALIAAWMLVLGSWQLIEYSGLLRFVWHNPINGGHGTPIACSWQAAQQARSLSEELGQVPVVVYSAGDSVEEEADAALWDVLLGDLPLYLVEGDGLLVQPSAAVFVSLQVSADRTYEITRRQLREAQAAAVLVRFVNGVDLLEASVEAAPPGQALPLTLRWSVWGIPPDITESYAFSVQLFDAEGRRLGQVDRHFLRTEFWRVGDQVSAYPLLPITEESVAAGEPLQLVIVMYRLADAGQGEGISVIDAAGSPAGQSFVLNIP